MLKHELSDFLFDFLLYPDVRKTLKVNLSGYKVTSYLNYITTIFKLRRARNVSLLSRK